MRPAILRRSSGYQLVEVLLVSVILALALTLSFPPIERWTSQRRLRLAGAEIATALRYAKAIAVRRAVRVGLKFYPSRPGTGGRSAFVVFRDGDGDGVRTADIDRGIDPQDGGRRDLAALGDRIRFGFPEGPAPRDPGDPGRRLTRLDDPIRFNRSDIASFDPLGTSTPGTVYLTDGRRLVAVRVFGATGKVKVIAYDATRESWK